tara:strand:+ start:38 stop:688 length:651 start_codon:yes stop_codon:yes gene_type:complete
MNQDLLTYIKQFGSAYNTEDSSLFFYALTKMEKYKTFVEFGTGLGCTAFAVASAMKENGEGKCITFDNGREYDGASNMSYQEYINSMAHKFGIQNHFILSNKEIDFTWRDRNRVDCVFADFDREVATIERLMSWALYSIDDYASIFIDGLYNYKEGFYYTKLLVNKLNENKIPNFLLAHKQFIEEHSFSLTTIRKEDTHNTGQDSMCWIKIESDNI